MDTKTTITYKKKGDKRMPLNSRFGFCPNATASENCLVVIPCPEDKHAVIIPETKLNELGFYHVDKAVHDRLSHLFTGLNELGLDKAVRDRLVHLFTAISNS
jgi:hypothetical protein